jgi:hypothetical protein
MSLGVSNEATGNNSFKLTPGKKTFFIKAKIYNLDLLGKLSPLSQKTEPTPRIQVVFEQYIGQLRSTKNINITKPLKRNKNLKFN